MTVFSIEVRTQMLEIVGPTMGEFFFQKGGKKRSGNKRKIKTLVGEVEISQKQARKLKVSPKIVLSPGLEKCCLRASAKTSYQQAEEDIYLARSWIEIFAPKIPQCWGTLKPINRERFPQNLVG